MKISLVSDVHLECKHLELPGGDVLILAGDVAEAKHLAGPEYQKFFTEECAKYQRVFYVLGNHEHYMCLLDETYHNIKELLPDNVTLLENEAVEYNGVVFLGATLWTDMNKQDPETMNGIRFYINDYRHIKYFSEKFNTTLRISPEMTVEKHKESLAYFKEYLELNPDKKVVVVTHMAPSSLSVAERYKNESLTNSAFYSELNDFILDHPNIKVWCHGHTHTPFDYMVGTTRVLCNPRGYVPYEEGNGFDVNFTFEV
jgi:predicted phosphodiesterase